MKVLFASTDILFGSQISQAAANAGADYQSIPPGQLSELPSNEGRLLLLVDLRASGLDLNVVAGLIAEERVDSSIAWGPHVDGDLLQQARDAGIGTVLPRGRFAAEMGQLIQAWVGTE